MFGFGTKKARYPWEDPNYPFDLDASMRIQRPAHGTDFFPYPRICGAIAMPPAVPGSFDVFTLSTAFGKNPYGPGVTSVPVNNQWNFVFPALSKTS